jgi:hypothetical protein
MYELAPYKIKDPRVLREGSFFMPANGITGHNL